MKFPTPTTAVAFVSLANAGARGAELPPRIVDCHHHFLDFATNKNFSSWFGGFAGDLAYLPEDYDRDVVTPLADANVTVTGTVHVEVMPDTPLGGVEEAKWIQTMVDEGRSEVRAIVGSCDLGDAANVQKCLELMNESSPLLRGIRWILDYVGPYDGNSATHLNAVRSDVDYLRGGEGGGVVPSFESGYASLAQYGWSFDAQLAPEQLPAMADLVSNHPGIDVVINHLGKPRLVLGPFSNSTEPDEEELRVWREGMRLMADLPNTYVKLSMLGFAVPDWILDPARIEVVRSLVLETVELFGPKRCMFGLNWHLGDSVSDNAGLGTKGPSPVELTEFMSNWLQDYSEEDREWIFAKTAETVYKFDVDDAEEGPSSGSMIAVVPPLLTVAALVVAWASVI
ncbi:hypothetical protein ACHAWF_011978 [Thalassiosira exigua]